MKIIKKMKIVKLMNLIKLINSIKLKKQILQIIKKKESESSKERMIIFKK